ncbi:hypothetical protein SAMN05421507_12310 [Lentzea jiangxiensis]|uniref:Uncharacterized protein n=1 Tax=Lentzea jiangxiensis TaxID=641025 RepID=A0A1H0WTV2_9PSEU|nr:hypothetical protein SAMN05421507_12310 [Lentzea jiangxiensis]
MSLACCTLTRVGFAQSEACPPQLANRRERSVALPGGHVVAAVRSDELRVLVSSNSLEVGSIDRDGDQVPFGMADADVLEVQHDRNRIFADRHIRYNNVSLPCVAVYHSWRHPDRQMLELRPQVVQCRRQPQPVVLRKNVGSRNLRFQPAERINFGEIELVRHGQLMKVPQGQTQLGGRCWSVLRQEVPPCDWPAVDHRWLKQRGHEPDCWEQTTLQPCRDVDFQSCRRFRA